MRFFEILLYPIRIIIIGLVKLYRLLISPIKNGHCVYYPTCSAYMLISVREWGLIKGVWLGIKRVLKCNPKHSGGIDYVPLNPCGRVKYML